MNIASDFSHAEDICIAIKKLMFNKLNLDTIILSSGKITCLNEIIIHIIKRNKLNIKIQFDKIKPKGIIGNNKFAKQKLQWRPKKKYFSCSE